MFEYFQMIAGNRLPDECVEIVKRGKENCEISVSAQCTCSYIRGAMSLKARPPNRCRMGSAS